VNHWVDAAAASLMLLIEVREQPWPGAAASIGMVAPANPRYRLT
jgi:hypothetical protein